MELQSSVTYWISPSITQHICNVYFIIYYTVISSLKRIFSHTQMLNDKLLEIQNKGLLLGFVFLCLFLYTYLSIFCYWKLECVIFLTTAFISVISSFRKIIWVLVLHIPSVKLPLLCCICALICCKFLFLWTFITFCFLRCECINWK